MRPDLIVPAKLAPGDRVAVVSPGMAAPGRWPEVHELAMRALREEIGVEPVEYPTTRQLGAAPQARAGTMTVDDPARTITACYGPASPGRP
jgi:hypothetical protein